MTRKLLQRVRGQQHAARQVQPKELRTTDSQVLDADIRDEETRADVELSQRVERGADGRQTRVGQLFEAADVE